MDTAAPRSVKIAPTQQARPRGHQGSSAGCMVVRRLCGRRHHTADRRRGAVRGARPPLGAEGARRRRRQRQRLARCRAALVRCGRDRLCARTARSRPRTRRSRRLDIEFPRSRRGSAAVCGWQLRRRRLDLRRDVHARPGARRRRAGSRLQARRQDRPCQLDAGRLHRPAVQDNRQARAAAGRRQIAGAVGHARADRPSCSDRMRRRSSRAHRHFVFRYRSPEHWLEIFRTYYGPVLKTFAALAASGTDGPRDRPHESGRAIQSFRKRLHDRAERVSRGRRHQALTVGRRQICCRVAGTLAVPGCRGCFASSRISRRTSYVTRTATCSSGIHQPVPMILAAAPMIVHTTAFLPPPRRWSVKKTRGEPTLFRWRRGRSTTH